MSEIEIDTPEGIVLRFDLAGPGTRTLAAAFDLFLFCVILGVLLLSLAALGSGLALVLLAGGILLLVGYPLVFALLPGGATPGKQLTGLRVVDQRGFPARFTQHLLRSLFLPLELAPPFVGLLAIVFTERHQRLGDLVAGTLVLRERRELAAPEPFPGAEATPGEAQGLTPAVAAGFGLSDLAFLREVLGRRELDARARERLVLRAAAHYHEKLGRELPPGMDRGSAYGFLRELYLYLRGKRGRLRG